MWILVWNVKTLISIIFRIFREAILKKQLSDKKKFFGEVELDEAYFGAKRVRRINMPQKRGRGTWKQAVFGVLPKEDEQSLMV